MKKYFVTPIGRLRLYAILEGSSLLILFFVAVPLKYAWHAPSAVKILGPIHGALFLLYIISAIGVGVEMGWKFGATTWKVILASFVPFGTFYIDRRVLRHFEREHS